MQTSAASTPGAANAVPPTARAERVTTATELGREVVNDVRRRLQGGLRHFIVGDVEPVRDLSTPVTGDVGLFGPGSVTWRVHGDAAMFVGGVRSLLVQTMHPLAMAGIAEHSRYRTDPASRLWQTARYVGAVTYGTTAQAEAALDTVLRVHRRVRGVAPDGRPYSANDPHLLLWVHHAMIDSFLRTYQRFGGTALTASESDRYIAEQAVIAERLGAEPAARSVAELDAWMREERADLRATAPARDAVRFLVLPPLRLAVRPAYTVIAAAAVGTLPAWMRWDLRLPLLAITDRLAVRPAALALTRSLDWIMSGAPARESTG